ncbi:ATP-binding protein, partial [Amycolatopsis sp. NPDC059090]|uniref:ATP-binding protein n=1 Tax=Amycolatopsis sp. NPDC059090 TaxID=3346723 RepID=UPI00366E2967
MSTRTTQVDDLRLVAQPSAVPCTELFVRLILTDWSLMPMLDQVTNAAVRLVGDVVDQSSPSAPAFVTVRLQLRGDRLVIEVDDDLVAPTPPRDERIGVRPGERGGRTTGWVQALTGGGWGGPVALPRPGAPRTVVDGARVGGPG